MTTSEPSQPNGSPQMELPLMSSAEGSRVRTFLPRVPRSALPVPAPAYGRNTPDLLARYDPATSSWRTSQLCLDGELSEFSATWPRSGTMRNGTAYQLPPLVRLTDATGSGLWPTPRVSDIAAGRTLVDGKRISPSGVYGANLADAVRMWPTPTSDDSKHVTRAGGDYQSLTRSVMWPTPQSRDHKDCGLNTDYSCERMMKWKLPGSVGGALNPTWVEWLMGFPLGWTVCEPSATPSSRKSRKSSVGQS